MYNKNGEITIPYKYDAANKFSGGLAAVKLNEKWGYINKEGKVVFPIKYEEVQDFRKVNKEAK